MGWRREGFRTVARPCRRGTDHRPAERWQLAALANRYRHRDRQRRGAAGAGRVGDMKIAPDHVEWLVRTTSRPGVAHAFIPNASTSVCKHIAARDTDSPMLPVDRHCAFCEKATA